MTELRDGLRVFRNAPAFAVVAVLSLALGIGANTAIFSIINGLLLKPLPVREPERLVRIVAGKQGEFTTALWEQLRDQQRVLDGVMAWGGTMFDLAAGGERRPVVGRYVSGTFFRTLGIDAQLGRVLVPADDARGGGAEGPVAVLSDAFWRREYAAAPDILGKPIRLNGHPVTIVGVAPRGFFGTEVGGDFDVAVPLTLEPLMRGKDSQLASLSYWWLDICGRLKPDQTLTQVNAALNVLTQPIVDSVITPEAAKRRNSKGSGAYLDGPFAAESMATGTSTFRERYRSALMMVMAIVGLVLLLACTNLASLLLARATARQHEFAVRLALGAGRARLVRQLLIESLMLAAAGAALGLLVARSASRLLLDQFSSRLGHVTLDVNPDWRVLLFTIGVTALTAMLFGIAPAWRSTNVTAADVLRSGGGSGSGSGAGSRVHVSGWRGFTAEKLLIVAQIAFSLVLVLGAALFVRSFATLTTLDPGFDARGVLLVDVDSVQASYTPEQRRMRFMQILDALREIPGVQHASSSVLTPMGTMAWNQHVDALPASASAGSGSQPKDISAFFNRISAEYPAAMGTTLLSGRAFNDRDTIESAPVALVNEAFARIAWPDTNPIGQRFAMGGKPAPLQVEVVGVLKDSKYRSLREQPPPTVFLAATQDREPFAKITYELRAPAAAATESAALVNTVKDRIDRIDSRLALDFHPFATQIRDALIRERVLALLSGFFGGLALLVAGIGLYGLMTLAVTRRRHEIGIRMALGAGRRGIIALMLRDVMLVTASGLTTGTIAAQLSGQLITKLLFGLSPNDPTTCAFAITALASVAAIAAYLPARRAARVDPMIALRDE